MGVSLTIEHHGRELIADVEELASATGDLDNNPQIELLELEDNDTGHRIMPTPEIEEEFRREYIRTVLNL